MRKDVKGVNSNDSSVKMKVQKIKKNDEKRRFRRSKVKVKKIRKNDEKRLSGGGEVQKKNPKK